MADRFGGRDSESLGSANEPGNPEGRMLKLTEEEFAVLNECRVKSVFFRGVPIAVVTLLVTRAVAKTNYLPFLTRRSGIYSGLLTGVGFLFGMASYRETCFQKIMALENSQLADQVRSYKRRLARYSGGKDGGAEFGSPGYEENLTSNEETADSLLRRRVPVVPPRQEEPLEFNAVEQGNASSSTSYEELRRRHRTAQQNAPPPNRLPRQPVPLPEVEPASDASVPYSSPPPTEEEISYDKPMADQPRSKSRDDHMRAPRPQPVKRNKYGDIVE